jgi:G:T-mismatch repair DNA endonuclease (very short patch repair protein)
MLGTLAFLNRHSCPFTFKSIRIADSAEYCFGFIHHARKLCVPFVADLAACLIPAGPGTRQEFWASKIRGNHERDREAEFHELTV